MISYLITFKVNYNLNQTIKKIDESTERNHGSQISSTLSFKKSGGLTIPTFFFRDFFIPNDMDFTLNFNWNTDQKLMTSTVVDDLTGFNEQMNNISWSLKPGDLIAFNFSTIHGAPGNNTNKRRRAFSARFVGDDATFAKRKGETSPPFLAVDLNHGDKLISSYFPLIPI